jgi:hypothetical protein
MALAVTQKRDQPKKDAERRDKMSVRTGEIVGAGQQIVAKNLKDNPR